MEKGDYCVAIAQDRPIAKSLSKHKVYSNSYYPPMLYVHHDPSGIVYRKCSTYRPSGFRRRRRRRGALEASDVTSTLLFHPSVRLLPSVGTPRLIRAGWKAVRIPPWVPVGYRYEQLSPYSMKPRSIGGKSIKGGDRATLFPNVNSGSEGKTPSYCSGA